jgi:thiamine-monophosphate kinase
LIDEDQLIERIAKAVPSVRGTHARGFVRLGIGDDAAVLAPGVGSEWVLSCDQFVDGVHFRAETYPADSVGYKSLVRATSDLAAMGASPQIFFLTLALSANRTGKWLDAVLRGMGRAARQLGMRLAGGDTTRSQKVSMSITVLGERKPAGAVTRAGARLGDAVCVSGRLGRAALGLELIERHPGAGPAGISRLLLPHLYPKIRIELGAWLARNRMASAMMDISDGLSTDLGRLCRASGVGARLWTGRIPCVMIPDAAARLLRGRRPDPLRLALHGGEDYELVFTLPRKNLKRLRYAPGVGELTVIGEIERGSGITMVGADGRERRLEPGGWDPFSQRAGVAVPRRKP